MAALEAQMLQLQRKKKEEVEKREWEEQEHREKEEAEKKRLEEEKAKWEAEEKREQEGKKERAKGTPAASDTSLRKRKRMAVELPATPTAEPGAVKLRKPVPGGTCDRCGKLKTSCTHKAAKADPRVKSCDECKKRKTACQYEGIGQ
ncbi:hypothetical protein M378DRAFT_182104 [Amanita muscaria Koide BX008]|uniref:Zn(2)-C6 fungal-type domain-containing protein n=1 Tax=Amanita muscaria (strain Koide BX008) TaxID=946122 RepID=A0A0C2SPI3_AMAMK|nr:hypothetical protein M378DRAFT_182104 [Amanita muscaria Koide BX008]